MTELRRLFNKTTKAPRMNSRLTPDVRGERNYVSTCKHCRFGIFKTGAAYSWQVRPIPGFVHDHCRDAA